MRVVYDTNILISAIFSQRGSPFRCLQLARDGIVQAVICQEILDEFQEKLLNKFSYQPLQAQAFVEEVRSYSQLVSITNTLKAVMTPTMIWSWNVRFKEEQVILSRVIKIYCR